MLRALLGRRSQAQEPRGTVELCLQLGSWGFMCFCSVDFIHLYFFHDLTMTEISEVMQSSEDPNCPSFSIRDDPLERPSHLFRRK